MPSRTAIRDEIDWLAEAPRSAPVRLCLRPARHAVHQVDGSRRPGVRSALSRQRPGGVPLRRALPAVRRADRLPAARQAAGGVPQHHAEAVRRCRPPPLPSMHPSNSCRTWRSPIMSCATARPTSTHARRRHRHAGHGAAAGAAFGRAAAAVQAGRARRRGAHRLRRPLRQIERRRRTARRARPGAARRAASPFRRRPGRQPEIFRRRRCSTSCRRHRAAAGRRMARGCA